MTEEVLRDPKQNAVVQVICQECEARITHFDDVVDVTENAPKYDCKKCGHTLPTPAMMAAFPWLKPKRRS